MMIGPSILMMGSAWIPSVNNVIPLSSGDPVQVALRVVDENRRVIGVSRFHGRVDLRALLPLGPVVACLWSALLPVPSAEVHSTL